MQILCCSECFSSSYLKDIINSNRTYGNCNFCNSRRVATYNPRELSLFFQNIFDLYTVDAKNGNSIEKQIANDFDGKIFSLKNVAKRKKLLQAIISDDLKHYKSLFTAKVILKHRKTRASSKKSIPLQLSWEKFAKEIRATNRFHIQNILDLSKLKTLLDRYDKRIPKGKVFYRARISHDAKGFKKEDMGNPPPDRAKAGRANPLGISYLYLANEAKTTLYEARVSLYDYVSIAEFQLKEDIRVINLRGDTYDPILLGERGVLEDYLIHLPFIEKLEQELSKPRRRSDNELDYLPTQYLSEFIKSMGFDGVEYQSAFHREGYNLAVFSPNKFTCGKVQVYEIQDLDLKHKKLV